MCAVVRLAYILVVGYALLITCPEIGTALSNEECQTQHINAVFILDGTIHVKAEEKHLMLEFIAAVLPTIPRDSIWSGAVVTNSSTEIALSTVSVPGASSMHYKYILQRYNWNKTGYSGKITGSAIEKEANLQFLVTKYKKKAEIVYMLISEATELSNIPAVLLKKKLFLIIFGSTIPNVWKDIASKEDHSHVIGSIDDVQAVAGRVINQTCKDSHFKCDIDEYMERGSIKCRSCMSVCSTSTMSQPTSCERNCPYIILAPIVEAVRTHDDTDRHGPLREIVEYKKTALDVVVMGVLGVVVVAAFGLLLKCRTRILVCFASSIGNDKMMDTPVKLSTAVMETGDVGDKNSDDTDQPIDDRANEATVSLIERAADNTDQPIDDRANEATVSLIECAADNTDHGATKPHFVIDFQSNKELDMNGEFFGGSEFKRLH